MKLYSWFLLTLFSLTIAWSAPAQQGSFAALEGNGDFLPVHDAFVMATSQQGTELTVTFQIAEGYYLYRHRFSYLPEEKLTAAPELPPGQTHTDEFFGESQIFRDRLTFTIPLADVTAGDTLQIQFQGCADAGLCYAPTVNEITLQEAAGGAGGDWELEDYSATESRGATAGFSHLLSGENLALAAGIFLLLGLGLAFTPCVFPMYPIISGIIMGQKRPLTLRRGFLLSFVYVQGMAITYTLLGILVALAGMQYQAYLQHPAILGSLAAIFVLLALVMFGLLNFDVPDSWRQKLNELSQRQRGGAYPSVFLMGVLSGLIASPCTTAPLSGALLFIAQSGDVVVGGVVLYALSIGMGIPLLIIGTSGGKFLPKSGRWMDTVKIIFGILLLAVAIFLAERLLPLTVAAIAWVLFFAGSALLLYRELHRQLRLRGRIIAAVILLTYASAGIQWQKPYLDGTFAANKLTFTEVASLAELEQELNAADRADQWVMFDLYADWCTACLELERYTFSDPAVQEVLDEALVLQADVTAVNATNRELLSEYQVMGLPTILFFDQDGQEIEGGRVTGFMSATEFEEHLEWVRRQ